MEEMTPEMAFFIYLLEQYAAYCNCLTREILREWEEHHLVQRIYDSYWGYHTESLENAFRDIDSLLATGHSAWA